MSDSTRASTEDSSPHAFPSSSMFMRARRQADLIQRSQERIMHLRELQEALRRSSELISLLQSDQVEEELLLSEHHVGQQQQVSGPPEVARKMGDEPELSETATDAAPKGDDDRLVND